jgi:hypothetical protein
LAKQFAEFQPDHLDLIAQSPVYFVATALADGRINLSPKGMDSLRVTGPRHLLWLNVTGSGNETAAHLPRDPRITLMWCSFTTRPIILRAYGVARVVHPQDADWADLAAALPSLPGARQIIDVSVDLVQASCGYAVPFMDFAAERPVLRNWAEAKGEEGLADYWKTRNSVSLDGLPTETGKGSA